MTRTKGFSLIELMLALAIGLILVAVVLRGFASTSANTRVNALVSEYQTNGRYALEVLKREAMHAAMHPMVWDTTSTGGDPQVTINATAAAVDFGCGAGVTTNVMAGIVAWDSGSTLPAAVSCVNTTSSQYLRGDLLMLRRAALEETTPTIGFDDGAPYLHVTYSRGNVYLGGETPIQYPTISRDYRLVSDLYFINDYTTSSTESPKVPALYRMTLPSGAKPALKPELVASNVEQFQVQFGEMDAGGNVRYRNAGSVVNWPSVVSVRMWLLLRASAGEPGLVSETYILGDEQYTPAPADNFRRTVLNTTINLRNK